MWKEKELLLSIFRIATYFEIDGSGDLTTITDCQGHSTRFSYNNHLLTSHTDERNYTTEYFYNDKGMVVEARFPNGEIRKYEPYIDKIIVNNLPQGVGTEDNPADPILKENIYAKKIDGKENEWKFKINHYGSIEKIIDPLNRETRFGRNIMNLPLYTTGFYARYDSMENRLQFSYDEKGNLIESTDPLGNKTQFSYDSSGNLAYIKDPEGKEARFDYDLMGRLIKTLDPSGGITSYSYEPSCGYSGGGLLHSIEDALGRRTTFEYDGIGQLIKITNPLGKTKLYTYDLNRNLSSFTNSRGQTINFEYDSANQLIKKIAPEGETIYSYDLLGNLTLIQNPNSRVERSYYLDKISSEKQGDFPEIKYSYDMWGAYSGCLNSLWQH